MRISWADVARIYIGDEEGPDTALGSYMPQITCTDMHQQTVDTRLGCRSYHRDNRQPDER